MLRIFCLLLVLLGLTACAPSDDLDEQPAYLGNFSLGHNVVVATKAETTSSLSREVSEDQLTTALTEAIAERFDRYEGEKSYHLGVSVEGYILGRRGVPLVASPKSAMIIRVTVWDDAQAKKLNVPPEQITVIEDIDGESLIGSGWLQTADTQLTGLSRNAAKAIETFMVAKNEELGWFENDEEAARRKAASEAAAAAEEAARANDAPPPKPAAGAEASGA